MAATAPMTGMEVLQMQISKTLYKPKHKYEKIKQDQAIRLVTILPGAPTDDMQCYTRQEIDLLLDRSSPYFVQFDALSYCWGSGGVRVPITLDGCIFWVGQLLFAALRRLRKPDVKYDIWIDAISINQSDLKEKAVQLQLMQDIYRTAMKTVVWLGLEADDSSAVIEYIRANAELEPERSKNPMSNRWLGMTTQNDYFYTVREPQWLPLWTAMFHLCARNYWMRMWIIQELSVSRNPVVLCGNDEVKWADFELVIGSIFAMVADRVPGATYFLHLWPLLDDSFPLLLDAERHEHREGSPPPPPRDARWLLGALQRYRCFESTEPHDKVYALLGLLDPSVRKSFKVNYKRDIRKVFFDTLKFLIPPRRRAESADDVATGHAPMVTVTMNFAIGADGELHETAESAAANADGPMTRAHGPLNVLCLASHVSSSRRGMPSWVPDWSDYTIKTSVDDLTNNRFTASQKLEAEYSFNRMDKMLKVKGFLVDVVTRVAGWDTPARTGPRTITTDFEDLLVEVRTWYTQALTSGLIDPDVPWRQGAFWKTLVYDTFPTGYFFGAPDEWEEMELSALQHFVADNDLTSAEEALLPSEYMIQLRRTASGGKAFGLSSTGMYMMLPPGAKMGDVVCVLWGCDIPVVLGDRDGKSVLIGEVYCDLLMDGTWIDRARESGLNLADITKTFRLY
ncbi:heterokaryon incompatibility protein-domain-containing protein [Lasiosphaeria hispida]|uniref:Heterokaryon incompatibility protein-domain-containing protein n=1 Tax=Lasiosphaeria hispida TaxID=260671 RepID=A0AAJ0HN46_9PEZI|nr:heterokaryon incompatibility protein-domain-containing protein [Lasiosphaeria hispida]